MVERDLFLNQEGGSIPTSPLQFEVKRIGSQVAKEFNEQWHSRLPRLRNWQQCTAYGAFFDGCVYAVALWSHPVARLFNGKGFWELRRFAISPKAPPNTASRLLSVMTKLIHKEKPEIRKLITYQDCQVHSGTIYRASGWVAESYRDGGREKGWTNRKGRIAQTPTDRADKCNSAKIRWAKTL